MTKTNPNSKQKVKSSPRSTTVKKSKGIFSSAGETISGTVSFVEKKAKEVAESLMPGASPEFKSLRKLFESEIADLYSAENQLIQALPKMGKKATNKNLAKGFEKHFVQTTKHAERLEKIAKDLKLKLSGKTCQAMKGLVKEGQEIIDGKGSGPIIDAALIGVAQRVEHYEIAGYGVVRAMAEALGYEDAAKILQTTLSEEGATDKVLTGLAESTILPEALRFRQ